jgi:hypothetical protein
MATPLTEEPAIMPRDVFDDAVPGDAHCCHQCGGQVYEKSLIDRGSQESGK